MLGRFARRVAPTAFRRSVTQTPRLGLRLTKPLARTASSTARRSMSTVPRSFQSSVSSTSSSLLALGGAFAAGALVLGVTQDQAEAAATAQPQPAVISGGTDHAGYVWIHLANRADKRECARIAARVHQVAAEVGGTDEDDAVLAAVGFGPRVVQEVGLEAPHADWTYRARRGKLGALPATGGDIFFHVKSNNKGNVHDVVRQIVAAFPKGAIAAVDDRYGWVYRNGRDLSGFIDGTENPADEDDRYAAAVHAGKGSAYVMTQRWIHSKDAIAKTPQDAAEQYVGRTRDDSVQLDPLPPCSHVARMVGYDREGKKRNIVRQSMPYGGVAGDSGLFFISYFNEPSNINFMLDRMTGDAGDGKHDDVMRFSKCVSGQFWYVPSPEEVAKL